MRLMVLDGIFHKTYGKTLLGKISKNEKKLYFNTNSIYFGQLVHSQECRTLLLTLLVNLFNQECDLGEQSILHAVASKGGSSRRELTKPLNQILSDLTLVEVNETEDTPSPVRSETTSSQAEKAHFFVFCSSPCGSLRTGKLRVRCSKCKSGAITVDADPRSWNDVLTPNRISGHCEAQNCPVSSVNFY